MKRMILLIVGLILILALGSAALVVRTLRSPVETMSRVVTAHMPVNVQEADDASKRLASHYLDRVQKDDWTTVRVLHTNPGDVDAARKDFEKLTGQHGKIQSWKLTSFSWNSQANSSQFHDDRLHSTGALKYTLEMEHGTAPVEFKLRGTDTHWTVDSVTVGR